MSTAIATQKWVRQHEAMADWTGHYWATRDWTSRDAVLVALKDFSPRISLVELGCNVGPMLSRIHAEYPEMILAGVDANGTAITSARGRVPSATFHQQDLMTWLPTQPAKSHDVIVTHYTLAYVAPGDILAVLHQCQRIARQGIVLAEPTGSEALIFAYPEWRHDYPALCRRLGMAHLIEQPIPHESNHLNQVTTVDLR